MRFTSRETRASLAFIGALAVIFFIVLATRRCGSAPVAPPAPVEAAATLHDAAAISQPDSVASPPQSGKQSGSKRKKREKKPKLQKRPAPDAPSPLDRPVNQL